MSEKEKYAVKYAKMFFRTMKELSYSLAKAQRLWEEVLSQKFKKFFNLGMYKNWVPKGMIYGLSAATIGLNGTFAIHDMLVPCC